MSFKPIDPKRDEFRRYLERNGVIESLTKVFVRIVKERPENPLDYLKHNLGDALQEADTLAYLQTELNETNAELTRLRSIIQNINPQILEEFDKEKLQKQQPQSMKGGGTEQPVAEASANVVNDVGENEVASNVDEVVASEADTQIVENQQKTELEEAVKECHISAVSEDETVKVAQNNASSNDKNSE